MIVLLFIRLVFVFIVFVLSLKLLKNYLSKRKLCKMIEHINGPKPYPIIGNGNLFRGSNEDILKNIMELSRNYESPIKIWFGQLPFFIITAPEQIETVLNNSKTLSKLYFLKFVRPVVGNGLFSAPDALWKQNRKLIAPTFNLRILSSFVATFYDESVVLTKILMKHQNEVINIRDYLFKYTIDVLAKTTMGVELNDQTIGSKLGTNIDKLCYIGFNRIFQLWYHSNFIFRNARIGKEFYKHLKQFNNYINYIISKRRTEIQENKEWLRKCPEAETSDSKVAKTFLDLLLELNEDKTVLSDQQLSDEVITLLIGGADSTASTLSFIAVMLGMHPQMQQRVYEEVMDVVGPERDIESGDLSRFEYMERFIHETNRLFPAAAVISRSVSADIDLGDCVLPAKSGILLPILSIQRSPKYWHDPLKFDPDRFLREEIAKRHPYTYIPFSAGPRNCIGKRYAHLMLKVLTAEIVRKFQISTPYKSIEDIRLQQNILMQAVEGFNVQLKARD